MTVAKQTGLEGKTKRTSLTIPEPLFDLIKADAIKRSFSVSFLVPSVLAAYYKQIQPNATNIYKNGRAGPKVKNG